MRRRFGLYLDKVLDRPRSTSPSGSKSPPETAKDAKAKLYSSTAVSTSLLNHPILKERYQTLRHEGLKNSIADLIGFLEGLDGSIEDYSVLSKLDNDMKELSKIVVPLSEDDNSSMSQRPSEQLAREIVAEIEKARSLTSYSSSSGSFSKTNFAQAISRLSDGLHASIKNYHVDPTCSKGSSSSTPRNIARATSGRVMGALSIAEKMLDGVPVPGLKAAVGGLLEVLGAINKLIDNDDDLIKLINHIEHLLGIVTKPLEDNKSGVDISLEQRVRDLAHDIQQITADAIKIKEQSLTNKFLGRADNASAIIGLSTAVDRAVDRFQVSGTMGVERGIGDLRGGVERLEVGSKGMEQGFKRLEDSVKNDMELIGKGIGKIETMLDDMEGSRLSVCE
ncbi:hypothetical protein FRC02_002647 [Tulasnella sp. 418]|nr:hypothetical protein FRC02_002647 [Tulasnella sp. 418]